MSEETKGSMPENSKTAQLSATVDRPLDIKSLIHIVQNQQVMLDSDLAALYQVETGVLNRAVKRNIERFPPDFRFQLSADEYENLRCQIGISSLGNGQYGGRRYLPYVFTEQGISMLASVLHSKVAVDVSVGIMRAFVEMRRFIASNSLLFEHITNVEVKLLEYEKKTDTKLDEIFEYINNDKEQNQKVFFDGQIYDAFSLIAGLVQKASTSIILIDGYVNGDTLDLLSKKNQNVAATIYTGANSQLTKAEIAAFNAQYPTLGIKHTKLFHDRFLILDNSVAYHIGASIKDAGKKCFAINLIEDAGIIGDILRRL
jgi:DNA-dependent RNA polymerase auxiliary subunit epsilon